MAIINPKTTVNIIPSYQVPQNEAQKILFIGQMTSVGTATSGQLYSSIGNENEQDALFGKNSIIARTIKAAKELNKINRFDAIPLDDDGAAVQATGSVTFTGTASASGTIYVSIDSVIANSTLNHKYTLDVADLATADSIGIALAAAITADDRVPVTAANVSGAVTFTAVNGGTIGNAITIKVEGGATDITITNTGMSSGATDPSLTNLFDPIGNLRYQAIVWPSQYDITDVGAFLDSRFNVDGKILDGMAIIGKTDTFANLKALGLTLNYKSMTVLANQLVNETLNKGSALITADYLIAAQFAAVRALRLTPGTDIAQYISGSSGSNDFTGGIHMASYAYYDTPFEKLPLIPVANMWTDTERAELRDAGIALIGDNDAYLEIIADQIVTTYKKDPAGEEDPTFEFLNYFDTETNVREYFHNQLQSRLRQARATVGDTVPGYKMADEGSVRAILMGLYDDLGKIALVARSEEARQAFKRNMFVQLDVATGTITISMVTIIVTQVREIAANMRISFSLNS